MVAEQNMIEQRILSMPVVTKRNIRFYGFIDMIDIVRLNSQNRMFLNNKT
jgi:signal-transduction protein with cAMP-binding, CBS, and nucleotidyltransferase domain